MEGVIKGLGFDIPPFIKELYFSITATLPDDRPVKSEHKSSNQSECAITEKNQSETKISQDNQSKSVKTDNHHSTVKAEEQESPLKRSSSSSGVDAEDDDTKQTIPKHLKLEP